MAANKSRRVKNIRDKLEEKKEMWNSGGSRFLGCPHVENVDESWMSELLFKSGEPRLRLVQWLLARFDPQLEELLESHQTVVSSLTDSRVGKLLFCATLLGLCRDDDVDLITGVSSKSKQLDFFEELIDMLLVLENTADVESMSFFPTTPERSVARPKTLDEAMSEACKYIDLLCRQENLQDVLKEKIHLYPPDIEKQFVTKDHENKRSQIPEIADLASLAAQTETELKEQNKILERLQAEASSDHDPQIVNNVSKTMSLTLSILSQMVDAFIHCYETEMKQWSGREKPHLSELGPVFKRVNLLLRRLFQILSSLEKLKMSHLQISRVKSTDIENNTVLHFTKTNNMQESIRVLDEAVKRRTEILDDSDSL